MSLFDLGQVTCTVGALQMIERLEEFPYLTRHSVGDWGEVDAHDWRENDKALKTGARLLSAYTLPGGRKVWVITEADRSSTCILLPEEY